MPFNTKPFGPLCAALACLAPPALAQDLLSRAEIEMVLQDNALCYYPDDRMACSWVEIYLEFNDDHTVMHTGQGFLDSGLSVLEFRLDWQDNGLCVDHDTQGLLSTASADGFRFPFDLDGLTPGDPADLPERVETMRANATPDACFRYSHDPDNPGQLRQHIFYGGEEQPELDPVALIPIFAGGVAVNPG